MMHHAPHRNGDDEPNISEIFGASSLQMTPADRFCDDRNSYNAAFQKLNLETNGALARRYNSETFYYRPFVQLRHAVEQVLGHSAPSPAPVIHFVPADPKKPDAVTPARPVSTTATAGHPDSIPA